MPFIRRRRRPFRRRRFRRKRKRGFMRRSLRKAFAKRPIPEIKQFAETTTVTQQGLTTYGGNAVPISINMLPTVQGVNSEQLLGRSFYPLSLEFDINFRLVNGTPANLNDLCKVHIMVVRWKTETNTNAPPGLGRIYPTQNPEISSFQFPQRRTFQDDHQYKILYRKSFHLVAVGGDFIQLQDPTGTVYNWRQPKVVDPYVSHYPTARTIHKKIKFRGLKITTNTSTWNTARNWVQVYIWAFTIRGGGGGTLLEATRTNILKYRDN